MALSCDVLIAHDPATARQAKADLHAGRVHVVPHPTYAGAYTPGRPRPQVRAALGILPDDFVFLSFGNIRPYKGMERTLSAFSKLTGNVRLVVAGMPLDEAAGDQVRRAAESDPRIVPLLGFVADADVAELFEAADCVVIARVDAGTSGAVVLALSLGVPVVAHHGYADILGKAGWLFDGEDPGQLAAAMWEAAADPQISMRARTASSRGSEWSWDAVGAQIAELLHEGETR